MTAGHWGARKTLQIFLRRYVFNNMKEAVDLHVKTCNTCQRVKSERKAARGKIQPLPIPEQKWHVLHMDWVLGLPPWPPNVGTYNAVLTLTDRATKMVHFVATSKADTAVDTARKIMNYSVRARGLPRTVICDRDSKFFSLFWQSVMHLLGISARTTSGFHPQANWQAERTNQNLRQYLRVHARESPDWPAAPMTAEMAINNAPLAGTKYSPYQLNLGYHPCLGPDIILETKPRLGHCQLAKAWMKQMQADWKTARAALVKTKAGQMSRANRNRQSANFKIGI